jgi:hypothetical protein
MPSSPAKTEVVARLSPGAHRTQSGRRLSAKLAVVEQTLQHATTHHHHHCGRAHRSTSRHVASRQTRSRRSSDERARAPGAAAPASSSTVGTPSPERQTGRHQPPRPTALSIGSAAAASARTASPMPAAPGRPGNHASAPATPTPLRRRPSPQPALVAQIGPNTRRCPQPLATPRRRALQLQKRPPAPCTYFEQTTACESKFRNAHQKQQQHL